MENKPQYSKAGLIASQNKDIRITLMSNLRTLSEVIACGNEEFVKKVLGEADYVALTTKGLFQLAYEKTNEVFKQFGFPNK